MPTRQLQRRLRHLRPRASTFDHDFEDVDSDSRFEPTSTITTSTPTRDSTPTSTITTPTRDSSRLRQLRPRLSTFDYEAGFDSRFDADFRHPTTMPTSRFTREHSPATADR